jgi:hypothetical protein
MEPERESVSALKGILVKIAPLVKPLGLSQDECTDLVQRMYESVLELDMLLAGEPDDRRRSILVAHIRGAEISREDDQLVVKHPGAPADGATIAQANPDPDQAPRPRRPRKAPQQPPTDAAPQSTADSAPEPGPDSAPESAQ